MGIRGGAWLAGLIMALALSAPADAAPAVPPPTHSVQLHLKGRGGYGISLFAVDLPKSRKSFVVLSASKQGKQSAFNFQSSSYSATGRVSLKGVHADFGRYGRVSLRFVPSTPVREDRFPGCRNGANTTQRGVFVGTIRFRGDRDFTEVDARRAKGSVGTQSFQSCGAGSGRRHHHLPHSKKVEEVSLKAATPHSTLTFSAAIQPEEEVFPGFPPVEYSATSNQFCGRVSVSRSVSVGGPAPSFAFDQPLTSATVSPPAPFSGSATFLRGPGGGASSWTGTLAVSFPGLDASLAGEEFDAALERRRVDPSRIAIYAIERHCPSGSADGSSS